MKIAVLIKQVPGSDSAFRASENELWIEEMQIQYEMNESDAYALEEALLIKEAQGTGEVVVVCMGPSIDNVHKGDGQTKSSILIWYIFVNKI